MGLELDNLLNKLILLSYYHHITFFKHSLKIKNVLLDLGGLSQFLPLAVHLEFRFCAEQVVGSHGAKAFGKIFFSPENSYN